MSDPFRPEDELTDAELDAVLAAADEELLGHIRAVSSPERLLSALLASERAQDQEKVTPPAVELPLIHIRVRLHAWNLSKSITRIPAKSNSASYLHLGEAVLHARHLVADLKRGGFQETHQEHMSFASQLVDSLGQLHERLLDEPFNPATFFLEKRLIERDANSFVAVLQVIRVDASDADLRALDRKITEMRQLNKVVWTERTIWPPSLRDRVKECSTEVGPGVWEVRTWGTEREVVRAR